MLWYYKNIKYATLNIAGGMFLKSGNSPQNRIIGGEMADSPAFDVTVLVRAGAGRIVGGGVIAYIIA